MPRFWERVQEMWKTQSFWKHVQMRSQDKTTSTKNTSSIWWIWWRKQWLRRNTHSDTYKCELC
jgi:hypothetical protein